MTENFMTFRKNLRVRRRKRDGAVFLVLNGDAYAVDALTDVLWRSCEDFPTAELLARHATATMREAVAVEPTDVLSTLRELATVGLLLEHRAL